MRFLENDEDEQYFFCTKKTQHIVKFDNFSVIIFFSVERIYIQYISNKS